MAHYKVGDMVEVAANLTGHRFKIGSVVQIVEVVGYLGTSEAYLCEDPETKDRWALAISEMQTIGKGADKMAAPSKFTREEIVLIVSTVALYMSMEQATDYADFANGAIQDVTKLGTEMRAEVGALDGIRAGQMLEGIAQKLLAHKE